MTTPLFSDTEMDAFREVALQGMQDDVAIYRRTTTTTADGQESVYTYLSTVKGWVYSTPTKVQTLVSGEIVTVNVYRLFVPVGTNIAQSDHVRIPGTSGQEYIVSDTIDENTWQAVLRVSLRFAE